MRKLFLLLLLSASTAQAAITVEPSSLTFTTQKQSFTVQVLQNGQPVPASAITDVRLMVDKHDYNEMMNIRKSDGVITLTPTDWLQIGTYDLVIRTRFGDAVVRVSSPLNDMETSLQNEARRLGITEQQLLERKGIAQEVVPGYVSFTIPARYTVGQTFQLTMPEPAAGQTAALTINGTPVAAGAGNTYNYTFLTPGTVQVRYEVLENGRVKMFHEASTTVVDEAPVPVTIAVNTTANLRGPEGYESYRWTMDGQQVSNAPVFRHGFKIPGTFRVHVESNTPLLGNLPQMRHMTYEVTVTPRR